jgi:hypothetical protein
LHKVSFDGVEVLGASLQAMVAGFQEATTLASSILRNAGIGEVAPDGRIVVPADAWYPADKALNAFREIAENIGASVQYQIGTKIPENAVFPPTVTDLESGLASIDIAYHMNHRKHGMPLFDPATGKLTDGGIGHYSSQRVPGKNEIVTVCDNPYPCDFDRGLITAIAKKFKSNVFIFHDESKPCRKKGGSSCTYQVKWT